MTVTGTFNCVSSDETGFVAGTVYNFAFASTETITVTQADALANTAEPAVAEPAVADTPDDSVVSNDPAATETASA